MICMQVLIFQLDKYYSQKKKKKKLDKYFCFYKTL